MLIGRSSTHLGKEALKWAVSEAKKGRDVQQYEDAVHALHKKAPKDPLAELDAEWIEKIKRLNGVETGKLDAELRGYKNNLIKESIRVWSSYSGVDGVLTTVLP